MSPNTSTYLDFEFRKNCVASKTIIIYISIVPGALNMRTFDGKRALWKLAIYGDITVLIGSNL